MAKPDDFDFYCDEALTGKTKIKKVYESNKILAYYHTKPKFKTHIVIIPKKHYHDIRETPDEILNEINKIAKKILRIIDVDSDGARFGTNLGKSQDTPHLHFHIISDGNYKDLKIN